MLLKDFYTIVEFNVADDKVDATIQLNPQHAIYQGHFPQTPVVPGVCMMAICKEILSKAVNKPIMLSAAKSVKFLDVINPFEQQQLVVSLHIISNELDTIKVKCQIATANKACYKAVSSYSLV